MAARVNKQTVDAASHVLKGMAMRDAAKKYGVHRTSIWREIRRIKSKQELNQKVKE